MKILDAIRLGVEKAEAMGIRVAIAVVDLRGEVVAVYKMEGAYPFTPQVAYMKARAAAIFRRPTAELAEKASQNLPLYLGLTIHADLIFGKGGLPTKEGGVGVSGGTGDQDEEVAREVAKALS
jgi:glc operon protein GlcG